MSLTRLSDLTGGFGVPFILDVESGQTRPSINEAYVICTVLGHDVTTIWPNEVEIIEETITVRRVKR